MTSTATTRSALKAAASSIDVIFPGHDVAMHDDYPAVADGITQLV